ncbi:hypothetical protein HG263_08370 [Pseudoalteromonas sp. JBTF-M23]|uniref:Uncharacterized protein n=1 Tax=Pseudoalteromonas caenipelagi TaxID=2726988 RepID=A0A849VBZ4_9GAMM|nr:hypothetical protein [Pseudoalteromonas caenipelagi]NOU50555.1 hypothetical protein [Pseudoalteromonas caenipelagi]
MKHYVLICAESGLVLKDEVFTTPSKTINPHSCYVELTEPVEAQPWLAQQSNEVVVFEFDINSMVTAEGLAPVVLEQDGIWHRAYQAIEAQSEA